MTAEQDELLRTLSIILYRRIVYGMSANYSNGLPNFAERWRCIRLYAQMTGISPKNTERA